VAATELLDRGIQESVIANHLGHHGLATLGNYAEVRPKRRQEALDALQGAMTTLAEPPPAKRHANRLVAQGEVIRAIEAEVGTAVPTSEAAGESPVGDVSEREARELAPLRDNPEEQERYLDFLEVAQ